MAKNITQMIGKYVELWERAKWFEGSVGYFLEYKSFLVIKSLFKGGDVTFQLEGVLLRW